MPEELSLTLQTSFATAHDRVVDALAQEGFGVLTSIDVRDTLHAKLGVDIEDYTILGVCNPSLAHQALEVDRALGLLLPCTVTLRQADSGIEVRALDPEQAFQLAPDTAIDALAPIASEARQRLVRAFRQLASHSHHN